MLTTIRYREGYKYCLVDEYRHRTGIRVTERITAPLLELWPDGLLVISPGYAWDGPSGPVLDVKSFMRASLVHDALYQLLRDRLLPMKHRKAADRLMRKICLQDGMSPVLADIAYQGVDTFGASYGLKCAREILTAP